VPQLNTKLTRLFGRTQILRVRIISHAFPMILVFSPVRPRTFLVLAINRIRKYLRSLIYGILIISFIRIRLVSERIVPFAVIATIPLVAVVVAVYPNKMPIGPSLVEFTAVAVNDKNLSIMRKTDRHYYRHCRTHVT